MANDGARVREQIEYYRERAPEYDDWFYQRGRYDEGERRRQEWQDETERAHAVLRSLGPVDEALELAGGTGIWTQRLLHVADRVTAVDASPEVIELARRRVRSDPRVTFEVADLFAYQPARRFDLISFTFWLSHVPPPRLPAFFALLQDSLRPGGALFAVDQRASPRQQTRHDRLQERKLSDGRSFDIVKVYYTEAEVTALFAGHGFEAEVTATPTLWIATAHRAQAGAGAHDPDGTAHGDDQAAP